VHRQVDLLHSSVDRGRKTLCLWSTWEAGPRGEEDEFVPRLVEALVGKKVAGASAGNSHHTQCGLSQGIW